MGLARMTYAAAKGRAIQRPATEPQRRPPKPLSEADQQRVADNRAFVLEHIPDLVPIIKDLHAIGYIDGWRNVINCKLISST